MYRALSRKMTSRDKASYDSTPPCSKLTVENFGEGLHPSPLRAPDENSQKSALQSFCMVNLGAPSPSEKFYLHLKSTIDEKNS